MKVLGIPVIFDPRITSGAEARGLWPFKRIAVGPSWYVLPPEERVAVLFHEVHHCRAMHMEARVLLLPLLLVVPRVIERVCRRQELAADRFAAAHGWAAHLAAMLKRAGQAQTYFYPSSDERIRALTPYLEGAESCASS